MKTRRETKITLEHGYSYVEILIATVLITVSLIPAAEALRGAGNASTIYTDYSVNHYQLMAKMEEVLAARFSDLEAEAASVGSETVATAYSDLPATMNRRVVYLSPYDADNADADNDVFTGTDAGLLWVRVELEDTVQSLEVLTAF